VGETLTRCAVQCSEEPAHCVVAVYNVALMVVEMARVGERREEEK
jgi:hypothetical protein